MKATTLFAAAMALIVGVGGWIFTRVYPTTEGRRAVLASALVAVVVQFATFAILRLRKQSPIAAWGAGAALRMGVLCLYALVAIKMFALASAPALLSLATFFFLSTLVEPLLLNV
ncbi:hypothetical protein tb265_05170 [Gemmatimonadetes bacterium T265]|nr:hypothetical protein tb265_05170 [Gemmatimonadetes bacterium T265]